LLNYLLSDQLFRSIIHTSKTTNYSTDQRFKHDLVNSNRLIQPEEGLYFPSALGGKTGFTFEAGHCLATAAENEQGKRFIAVVLHTNVESKEASAQEVRKLLAWAMQK
jgi:D-alanyl-D-alanine carboxypeptidase (penicillin-binding protein 5/6)